MKVSRAHIFGIVNVFLKVLQQLNVVAPYLWLFDFISVSDADFNCSPIIFQSYAVCYCVAEHTGLTGFRQCLNPAIGKNSSIIVIR